MFIANENVKNLGQYIYSRTTFDLLPLHLSAYRKDNLQKIDLKFLEKKKFLK